MTPKHIKQVPESRKAISPYNFVELPDVVVPAEEIPPLNQYHSNRHTGKIECVLTTDSPLYIRCGMTPENFAKFSGKDDELSDGQKKQKRKIMADFFQYPTSQFPALAGSSLRGMLRTLVEIAGYGKLNKVSDYRLIYRAVGDTSSLGQKYRDRLLKREADGSYSFLMQAGYIVEKKLGWAIQPDKLLSPDVSFARIEHNDIPKQLENWKNIKNSSEITVQVQPIKTHKHGKGKVRLNYAKVNNAPGSENGVLVKTGSAPRKHMEFVFGLPNENENEIISIPNEMIDRYKEQITDGQTKIVGSKGILQEKQPIFYLLEDGKLIFFGHAMMFRLPYEESAIDFIPQHLRDSNKPDLAEAIFGFVQDEKQEENQAQAGRVFIGDAICQETVNDDIWWKGDLEKSMTPLILASPKPTTFQHYLVQTTADKKELKHYGSEPAKETVIRGHKLYWHKGGKPSIKLPENQDSESQTTDIKPIKSGVSFNFTIHFENLSAIELGALLWVLNLAADPKYRLSLGMGKPLGMGAVKITHKLWLCDRTNRYSKLFQNNNWATGDNLANVEESEQYVNAFESHILKSLREKGETAQKLKKVPRIKMLLAMLSFPGLSPDTTRYMKIEPDNEYQERPVLPTPLQVMEWPDDRTIDKPPPSPKNPPIKKSDRSTPKPKLKSKKTDESKPKKRDTEGGSGTNLALQRPPKKPKR